MAKHTLNLEVFDTRNTCIFLIKDTSIYADNVPVECPYLDILLPGFSCTTRIEVTPGFDLSLTACDLNIQTRDCGVTMNDLPDGVYSIKYSVAPNEYVFVEYNYLRVTNLLNKLDNIYCGLNLSNCEPPYKTKEKLKQIREIESYIKAARYM